METFFDLLSKNCLGEICKYLPYESFLDLKHFKVFDDFTQQFPFDEKYEIGEVKIDIENKSIIVDGPHFTVETILDKNMELKFNESFKLKNFALCNYIRPLLRAIDNTNKVFIIDGTLKRLQFVYELIPRSEIEQEFYWFQYTETMSFVKLCGKYNYGKWVYIPSSSIIEYEYKKFKKGDLNGPKPKKYSFDFLNMTMKRKYDPQEFPIRRLKITDFIFEDF